MQTSQEPRDNPTTERHEYEWRAVSAAEDTIQIRVAPVSDISRELVAKALAVGKAATNTPPPPKG